MIELDRYLPGTVLGAVEGSNARFLKKIRFEIADCNVGRSVGLERIFNGPDLV